MIFPFYGASNKTKGRSRAWLIFMGMDPLFGVWRKTGPTRQSSQEPPALKTPGSTHTYTHHGLQRLGIAPAALRQVKSRGGSMQSLCWGAKTPYPAPCETPAYTGGRTASGRIIGMNATTESHSSGKCLGTHQKLNSALIQH